MEKYFYLNVKFKNQIEFIFEISATTKERLEVEISQANNISPKFIYFETCDIRDIYICPKHLHEAYFETRPNPADADESIDAGSLVIYTIASTEPLLANQEGLDTDAIFLDSADDKERFINVELASNEFKFININTIALAMIEKDLFE